MAAETLELDLRMAYGRALRDERQFMPAASQFAAAAQRKKRRPRRFGTNWPAC